MYSSACNCNYTVTGNIALGQSAYLHVVTILTGYNVNIDLEQYIYLHLTVTILWQVKLLIVTIYHVCTACNCNHTVTGNIALGQCFYLNLIVAILSQVILLWDNGCTRVLQKVLSLGSYYFSAMFYQTYFYYKPSKYSTFTETHFCNLFTQSQKADK